MFANNLRLLCTALGFTAVILKDKVPEKDRAARAVVIALMIEEFCRAANPTIPQATAHDADELDQMIENLKEGELHIEKLDKMTTDKALARRVYDRLLQRHRIYATDRMIADEIEHFLHEEINHSVGPDMLIAQIQGNEDLFAPCQSMATAIVEILKTNGECSPNDLVAKGFSPDEIKRHWPMAYALAKVELNWMDA